VSIPDERLMAYADGELDADEHAAERAEIEAAMKADPAVARRVEQHRALRTRVSGSYNTVLDEPVPDRLLAAVRNAPTEENARSGAASPSRGEASVTDLERARAARAEAAADAARKRSRWTGAQWAAIAASLVFGAIIGHFALRSAGLGPIAQRDGRLVAQSSLDQALSTQLVSEQSAAAPVHIGVSFKNKGGEYCRTFVMQQGAPATSALSGLACRQGGAWDVRALARADASTGGEGGYHPAGSELPPSVRAAVDDQIDGEPLDAPGEAQARTKGWH
jgi:anti-sigma factor RsiW